jgi:RimJ/RimL family protein N-acetyltransferase
MQILPMEPMDLTTFPIQAIQHADIPDTLAVHGERLVTAGDAWTARVGSRIICCAGLVDLDDGRALVWAFLAADCGRYLTAITREVRAYLDEVPFRRIETLVRSDFKAGWRWAHLLGFQYEGTLRAFWPDGRDADLFARIKR